VCDDGARHHGKKIDNIIKAVLRRSGTIGAVQTYARLTLQNATLLPFATALRTRARIALATAVALLGMGLLVPSSHAAPAWRPLPTPCAQPLQKSHGRRGCTGG
jgi:CHASE2 domain-containing sensor protein